MIFSPARNGDLQAGELKMAEQDPNKRPASIVSGMIGIHLEYEIISTTNEFFGTVRNITLDSGYVSELDLSELHQLLYEEGGQVHPAERISRAAMLVRKLRGELDTIDRQLDPSKFRRVFERIGTLGTHTLELVIQYYLTKPVRDKEDRDKLDLLATRWGSYSVPGTKAPVLRPSKDLEHKLAELYTSLNIELQANTQEEEVLEKLKEFSEEIGRVTNFREIIDQQLVRRLREYKASLDESFYRPKILASIVDVNIAVHNLFQQLYDSEQGRLHLYLEQAKKSALSAEQATQLAQFQPVLKMMNRAAQMEQLLDDIKHVLSTQQVIDQAFMNEMERTGRKMRDLTELLLGTLQNSRNLGEELHKSLSELQRLEKVTILTSATEKKILENIAKKLGQSTDELIETILENALINFAEAVKNDRLFHVFPDQSDQAQTAISFLIQAGYAETES
jgi:hypothetical protein